jgi:hypothetical protein
MDEALPKDEQHRAPRREAALRRDLPDVDGVRVDGGPPVSVGRPA